MMPLTFVNIGEENIIKRVGGNSDVRLHLEKLGFVPGSNILIVSAMSGNVIVNVKGSRVAISKEMATKIMV